MHPLRFLSAGPLRENDMALASSPATRTQGELREVTLSEIALRLHRRRILLAVTILLSLAGGAALTFFTEPQYESQVSIIPLEHPDIIKSWLESRQAAAFAAETLGARLNSHLFPDEWDDSVGGWRGSPPDRDQIATRLNEHVFVSGPSSRGKIITVTGTFNDAALAHDVVSAYALSLDQLRPELQNLTRAELFNQYQASAPDQALEQAEAAARLRAYWLAFDDATLPESPSKPRPAFNLGVAGLLGIVGGVGLVFALDWLRQYRSELDSLNPPPM